jgi:hypothetical protein
MILQTTNPYCFIYKTDESATADRLMIELLGGIRIEGLDRMRVTIKVTVVSRKLTEYLNNAELAGLSVRHNLDLYNDTQVEKFVRRVAEKLETGSIAVTKAIADITSQLEEYRLKQLDKQETRKEKAISKEERENAMHFLEQKDLLNSIEMPEIKKYIEDIDIGNLDQEHIIPNMAPPIYRGIWSH